MKFFYFILLVFSFSCFSVGDEDGDGFVLPAPFSPSFQRSEGDDFLVKRNSPDSQYFSGSDEEGESEAEDNEISTPLPFSPHFNRTQNRVGRRFPFASPIALKNDGQTCSKKPKRMSASFEEDNKGSPSLSLSFNVSRILTTSTPHGRAESVMGPTLPTNASFMATLFSPQGKEAVSMGQSIPDPLLTQSPNKEFYDDKASRSTPHRQEQQRIMFEREIKEIEGVTIALADMTPKRGGMLQDEFNALLPLKAALGECKKQFALNPSQEILCRSIVEELVNGKICLSKEFGFSRAVAVMDRVLTHKGRSLKRVIVQNDAIIDPWKVDDVGRTNIDRMFQGVAPLGPDGKSVNLHHLVQSDYYPIIEVTQTSHQQGGAHLLHYKKGFSEFGGSRVNRHVFDRFRSDYWKLRAQTFVSEKQDIYPYMTRFQFQKAYPEVKVGASSSEADEGVDKCEVEEQGDLKISK